MNQDETSRSTSHPRPVRKRNPDESKKRILDSAERAFALRGFDGARLRDIAQDAGVHHALAVQDEAEKQWQWLEATLAEAAAGPKPHVLPVMHHPPFLNVPTEDAEYKTNGNRAKIHLLRSSLIELTNPLSSKDALKKVKELRSKHSSLFSTRNMFLVTYEILSRYRFQLHVRRYVHDIFKIGLGAFSKAIGEAEVA